MLKNKNKAFTIVELLTVIGVITLIIGLLVPSLGQIQRLAKDMKQKAQFHSIKTAMELYKNEFGDYVDSAAASAAGGKIITGSHKLTEALLGRDLQGFDPASNIGNPEDDTGKPYGLDSGSVNTTFLQVSLDRRDGPYLSMDNLTAFDANQIYELGSSDTIYAGRQGSSGFSAPLLTDTYKAKKISVGGKTVSIGTPILYYKADLTKKLNDKNNVTNCIYNIFDNQDLVVLGDVKTQDEEHEINESSTVFDAYDVFYEKILRNDSASASLAAGISRPYRPESYVLISAGFDGIFGTSDDITNFEE